MRAPTSQRGAAALIVTLLLFFAMLLTAAFVNRNLVFEQRIAANQVRSTQAFEAAQAGLDWGLAMLNRRERVGADCLPSSDPALDSFRGRYLDDSARTGIVAPRSWMSGTVATPLLPTCVRSATAWSCACPAHGPAALTASSGSTAAPAFTLQFLPVARPGMIRLRAIGCTGLAGACQLGSSTGVDASAQLELTVALIGGLRTPPAAALTTLGAFDADASTLGVHNADPVTGIAIHAGGRVAAAHARLSGPAGAVLGGAVIGADASLAALSPDAWFASLFGIDKATWKAQAGVTRLRCDGDCTDALTAAVAATPDTALISIDGDLAVRGPLTLGSTGRPVLLIASGTVRFEGAVGFTGVVHAAALEWNGAGGGAFLRGAALSETTYHGDATPEIVYDTAVLGALLARAGSFGAVSGSWRDFF